MKGGREWTGPSSLAWNLMGEEWQGRCWWLSQAGIQFSGSEKSVEYLEENELPLRRMENVLILFNLLLKRKIEIHAALMSLSFFCLGVKYQ